MIVACLKINTAIGNVTEQFNINFAKLDNCIAAYEMMSRTLGERLRGNTALPETLDIEGTDGRSTIQPSAVTSVQYVDYAKASEHAAGTSEAYPNLRSPIS